MAHGTVGKARASEGTLGEVARYFFRLGVIAFGGPAAHIALMRRELVRERGWLTDEELLDMLGAANLIPGPNSTELTMHLGAKRAGWRGLFVGGFSFIFPAVVMVLALAWAYVRFGTTDVGQGLIAGIEPVILAIIVQAIWGLRGAAVKGYATAVVGVAALALAIAGVNEILLIFGGGFAILIWSLVRPRSGGESRPTLPSLRRPMRRAGGVVRRIVAKPLRAGPAMLAAAPASYSLWDLFLIWLKIGAVLYGSGYVLAAFLQSEFVDQRGWLTNQQVVDAIAAGQFTPGPLFSSAAFAGYIVDGWQGALVSAAGIFLPSFILVLITYPIVPKLRRSPWASPFLDGVNVAALALMAVVTVTLARHAIDDPFAIVLFLCAALVLVRFSPNSVWMVLAGAAVGLARGVV